MKHRWTNEYPAIKRKRIRRQRIQQLIGEATLQLGVVAPQVIDINQN